LADTACDEERIRLLNSRDIAALNRARNVLKRLEDAAWRRSLEHYDPYAAVTAWDLGRLSDAASAADDAIFRVLSTARVNCHLRITDDQLFGTEQAHPKAAQTPEAPQSTDAPTPSTVSSRSSGAPVTPRRGGARTPARR
jgi:hypothetical protein